MSPGLEQINRRLSSLEAAVFAGGREEINGWSSAARMLGLSVPTVKRRAKEDPSFPAPLSTLKFTRRNARKTFLRPRWKRADLLRYQGTI